MPDAPPPGEKKPATLSVPELVTMVATLSALNALSIDIMLPALADIGRTFALANANDRQMVVGLYLTCFGVAQLAYGPLADAFGRRRVLNYALAIYVLGSILCVFAPTFELLLAARALQGIGAAATRVIASTIVRDLTSGRRMAQVMSMAMTVFMIVPIVAPGLGQLILFVAPWRWIFGALLIYALVVLAWIALRLPETLRPENRTPFQARAIASAYASVLSNRQMLGYMAASTCVAGALFGYIMCSEQIFSDIFQLGPLFPFAFASVAVAITIGTFLNARLVMRHGMRRISHTMLLWFTFVAITHAGIVVVWGEDLWVFLISLALTFVAFGLTSGNFNALAMESMGHVAGSAASLFGAVTATCGAMLGALIARGYDGTTLPFSIGLALAGAAAIIAVLITERGKLGG